MREMPFSVAKGNGLTNGAPLEHEMVYNLYFAAEL